MSATLGGLLKDYRLQKNLSQLEIAFALGWKEPSRLSRIEQGVVEKPKRELLERILDIMEVNKSERNNFLLAGGYLPTEEEIKDIRKETNSLIENWQYPAHIMDFSWRIVHWNDEISKAYDIKKDAKEYMYKTLPRLFNVIFDPEFIQNKYLKGKEFEEWKNFLLARITLFKYEQRDRTKEKWYINHVKEMMGNKLFRELWTKAKTPKEAEGLKDYAWKSLVNGRNKSKRINFHLFNTTFMQDPRFEVVLHVPSNLTTFKNFHKK